MVMTNRIGAPGTAPTVYKKTKRTRNKKNRDHPNNHINRLEYWEESWRPEERFVVTQIPVKNHQLKLVWEIRKKEYNNNEFSQSV